MDAGIELCSLCDYELYNLLDSLIAKKQRYYEMTALGKDEKLMEMLRDVYHLDIEKIDLDIQRVEEELDIRFSEETY